MDIKNLRAKAKSFLKWQGKTKVKSWQLSVILILGILGTVYGLRHNNLHMIKLRDQVLTADNQNQDVAGPLTKLSNYVFHHMNTSVNDLELVNSYNRDVSGLVSAAQAEKNSQASIYQEAQSNCEHAGEMITTIAQCAQNYVLTHLSDQQTASIKFPDKTLYTYNFAAPLWSPDVAGWSLVVAILSAAWLIERGVTELIAVLIVRRRL